MKDLSASSKRNETGELDKLNTSMDALMSPGDFKSPSMLHKLSSMLNKSPSMLNKSPSMLNKPPSMLHKPSSMLNKPPSMLHKPSSMLNKQASMLNKPSSMLNKPSSMLNKQASMPRQSATMLKQLAVMQNQPGKCNNKPSIQVALSPNGYPNKGQPILMRVGVSNATMNHLEQIWSSAGGNRSGCGENRSSSGENRSSRGENRSSCGGNRSSRGENKSSCGENRSGYGEQRAEVNQQEIETEVIMRLLGEDESQAVELALNHERIKSPQSESMSLKEEFTNRTETDAKVRDSVPEMSVRSPEERLILIQCSMCDLTYNNTIDYTNHLKVHLGGGSIIDPLQNSDPENPPNPCGKDNGDRFLLNGRNTQGISLPNQDTGERSILNQRNIGNRSIPNENDTGDKPLYNQKDTGLRSLPYQKDTDDRSLSNKEIGDTYDTHKLSNSTCQGDLNCDFPLNTSVIDIEQDQVQNKPIEIKPEGEIVPGESEEDYSKANCGISSEILATKQVLAKHMKTHSHVKQFTVKFTYKSLPLKSENKSSCQVVPPPNGDRNKPQSTSMQGGIPNTLQEYKVVKNVAKPMSCAMCGQKHQTQLDLNKHILESHGATPNMILTSDAKASLDADETPNIYTCIICGLQFHTTVAMRLHRQRHRTQLGVQQCAICHAWFSSHKELQTHKKTHPADYVFTCTECNATFTRKSNFEKHQTTHREVRPYACNLCCKSFAYWSNMNKHRLSHKKQREIPQKCSSCNESFSKHPAVKPT